MVRRATSIGLLWAAAIGLSLAASPSAMSQAWPKRPVELIVPFPAGGANDVLARAFAEQATASLGQTFIVVNRDGASGTIGTAAVAAAPPDGYTLLFTPNGPIGTQPSLKPDLSYGAHSFVGICQLFRQYFTLAVVPESPIKNYADLVEAARAQPGAVAFGFGGVGTAPFFIMKQLEAITDTKMLPVPFRGDPPAVNALRSGEIDVAALTIATASAQQFRLLAIPSARRYEPLPDVPTATELGAPIVQEAFGGLVGPKGLSEDVIARLETVCKESAASERFVSIANASGQEIRFERGEAFTRNIAEDAAAKAKLIREAGIKVE